MSAFRLLGERIQKGANPYNLNLGKVNAWAQQQLPNVQKFVNNLFNRLDPSQTGVSPSKYS
jgi:hypothetical protein